MNISALYSSIIVVHLLKHFIVIGKNKRLETSFSGDRGHLFSETIGISHIFVVFILSKLTK